jgi:hypothetical protein
LNWGDYGYPKGFRTFEVFDVMGDDVLATRSSRQLQDEVVVRIVEERSPSEKYLLMLRQVAKHIDDHLDISRCEFWNQTGPEGDSLIFESERNRKSDAEFTIGNGLQ